VPDAHDESGWTAEIPPVAVARTRLRVAALLEVVACSGLPTQLALHGLLALVGIHPYDAARRLSTVYVFTISIADTVVLVCLAAWFLRLHGESWRAVFLGARPLARESLLGVLQVPLAFLLAAAVMLAARHLAPWLHDVQTNPMAGLITSRAGALGFAAVAVIAGGVREEVQRAFILHRFDQHLGGAWVGLALFSLVFGAGHVVQGRDVALATTALGLFWGAVYLRRRSVAAPVVCHAGFNAAEIVGHALFGS
jgi:membrane protease YdiL (CAAX protease family)